MTTPTIPPMAETHRVEILPVTTGNTCDRCGDAVIAIAMVLLPNGGMLTLCAHHTRKHGFGDVWREEESRLKGNA